VIDFSVLKSKVGGWIDDNLDHTMLLHPDDPLLKLPSVALAALFPERKPFLMPAHYPNPTAENIARLIYERSRQLLDDTDIEVYDVTVHETPNCSAEYTADFT
jgi:6-pyruvoyltetrahydropterin/6-carboxytetrahydropterin synthase